MIWMSDGSIFKTNEVVYNVGRSAHCKVRWEKAKKNFQKNFCYGFQTNYF